MNGWAKTLPTPLKNPPLGLLLVSSGSGFLKALNLSFFEVSGGMGTGVASILEVASLGKRLSLAKPASILELPAAGLTAEGAVVAAAGLTAEGAVVAASGLTAEDAVVAAAGLTAVAPPPVPPVEDLPAPPLGMPPPAPPVEELKSLIAFI